MKKTFLVLIFSFTILNARAESRPGFTGCGDYLLKGMVIKNTDVEAKTEPFVYVINPKSLSQMIFTFSTKDLGLLASYLDVPTTLKVKILKKMDGTKGEITEVDGVSIRKPNPLDPYTDSGIYFQSRRSCQQ